MNKNKIVFIIIVSILILSIICICFFININKNKIENISNEDIEEILIYDIEEGYLTVPYNKYANINNYDFDKYLIDNNGYYSYQDNNYKAILGIDVSEYQRDIDWSEVKKSGIEFAILRLGYRGYGKEGKIVLDSKFEDNYQNAKKENIKIGVYFFSQAISIDEVKQEAEFVLENLEEKYLDYPLIFDLEKIRNDDARTDNLTSNEINNITLEFCKTIQNNSEFTPALYGNAKTFTTNMNLELFNNYQKWYADYQEKPIYPYEFDIWQYTDTGVVNGITGNVDMDLYFEKGE